MNTSFGEEELVCVLLVHLFVCFVRVSVCPFSLSLGVGGLAAVCDCGTPWTFLLAFFVRKFLTQFNKNVRIAKIMH